MVSTMVRIHAMDVVKLGIAYAYENLRTEHGLKFPLSSNHITSWYIYYCFSVNCKKNCTCFGISCLTRYIGY